MKVFKSFFKIIYSVGFILFLVIISYIIASFSYYSHEVGESKIEEFTIIDDDKTFKISAKNEYYITIEMKSEKKEKDEIIINYALDYFDKYKTEIYLYDYTYPYTLVTVNKKGETTLSHLISLSDKVNSV